VECTNRSTAEEQKILFPRLARLAERYKKRIEDDARLAKPNKTHLRKYFKHCQAKGISVGRTAFVVQYLYHFAQWAGKRDFLKLSRDEINDYVADLRETRAKDSVNGYIGILKAFYRVLNGLTSMDPAPEPVKHLQKEKETNFIRKEVLLTDEEIDRVFDAARTVKYKAILAVLCCGLRPGEVRSLKIGDVSIDNECIKIRVAGGKMGGRLLPRTVFVKKGAQYLQAWLLGHPRRDQPYSFLFGENKPKWGFVPLGDNELRSALKRFAKKAGVLHKKWCAYGYRHKTLTDWYTNPNLGYEIARRLAGHGPRSRMSEVYCHVDDDALKRAFLGSEKNKFCEKCGNANDGKSDYCSRCGFCFSTRKLAEKQMTMEDGFSDGLEALEFFMNRNPQALKEMIRRWKNEGK